MAAIKELRRRSALRPDRGGLIAAHGTTNSGPGALRRRHAPRRRLWGSLCSRLVPYRCLRGACAAPLGQPMHGRHVGGALLNGGASGWMMALDRGPNR